MSEKRFTTTNGVFYKDNKTGWEFQCYEDVVKLMNDLADRITMLEEDLLAMNMTNGNLEKMLKFAKEENEQLRQTTKTQQIRIYCQDKEIQKLNEQLNKIPNTIKEVWLE